jgi:hypothetical protein
MRTPERVGRVPSSIRLSDLPNRSGVQLHLDVIWAERMLHPLLATVHRAAAFSRMDGDMPARRAVR